MAGDGEGAGAIGLEREGVQRGACAVCACVAPFASAHFLEKMYQVSHSACRIGFGRGQHEIDRVIVDLHGLHVGGRPRLDLRAWAAHALEREDDVIGREVFAAVELDALAQMEAPLQGIDDLPALGQARDDLQVLIPFGQPLHDIAEGPSVKVSLRV